jgi:hypothetical protein
MSNIRKSQTLTNNPTKVKVDQILNWKKSFDLKVVFISLFWFTFMSTWMILMLNYGEAFIKNCIPAFLILSFILIMRTIENINN